ncbi:MAG TPA: hypothetical protein VLH56_15290 [Dissulfurispiraceae bacterium]|nr:hypothetical protein [Dissulfurispiraceae bacterium]
MKPIFHAAPVNSPFEDPSVYVRIMHERRALLFDCGDIRRLDAGHVVDITDVFVTHMHIDHFVGFDTLMRTLLYRKQPLRVYGPAGIIACIEGKLKGYTWNLIRDYPLTINVSEVAGDMLRHSRFAAPEGFVRIDGEPEFFDGTLLREPLLSVSALRLSHQVPSLGYQLKEAFHINIRKEGIEALGLAVGPWLSGLKNSIRAAAAETGSPEAALAQVAHAGILAEGRFLKEDEILRIVLISRGQKMSYIMDTSPTEENISAIVEFVQGSDDLFCEAYFLQGDAVRARERHHLTAALAGRIACEAEVARLSVLHFSPKYRDAVERIYLEAGCAVPPSLCKDGALGLQ